VLRAGFATERGTRTRHDRDVLGASVTWIAFGLVLGAVAFVRLVELRVSIARTRDRAADVVREPLLFPAMAALHAAFVTAPLVEVALLDRPVVPGLAAGAAFALALATALRVWTLRTLGAAWNVRVVDPSPVGVATGGPYAWIRHPNYLCVILEIASVPLLHSAWLSAVALSAVNAVVLARRIRNEEALLSRIPAWRDAMSGKARLVPHVW
jgi:methyltransferase